MNTKIKYIPAIHKGKEIILIQFPYDKVLIKRVKSFRELHGAEHKKRGMFLIIPTTAKNSGYRQSSSRARWHC